MSLASFLRPLLVYLVGELLVALYRGEPVSLVPAFLVGALLLATLWASRHLFRRPPADP